MQIAICDDIQKELETIRAVLDAYSKVYPEYYFDIDEYRTTIDILHAVGKGKIYAVTAFAMNATHYLVKLFSQEPFIVAFDSAVKTTEDWDFLSFACVDGMHRVRNGEIISIELQNYYLLINLSSGEMLWLRMKLSQMIEEVQKYSEFTRAGVSYVANLTFVWRIARNSLEICNGSKIPVLRKTRGEAQRLYMDFCRKGALK